MSQIFRRKAFPSALLLGANSKWYHSDAPGKALFHDSARSRKTFDSVSLSRPAAATSSDIPAVSPASDEPEEHFASISAGSVNFSEAASARSTGMANIFPSMDQLRAKSSKFGRVVRSPRGLSVFRRWSAFGGGGLVGSKTAGATRNITASGGSGSTSTDAGDCMQPAERLKPDTDCFTQPFPVFPTTASVELADTAFKMASGGKKDVIRSVDSPAAATAATKAAAAAPPLNFPAASSQGTAAEKHVSVSSTPFSRPGGSHGCGGASDVALKMRRPARLDVGRDAVQSGYAGLGSIVDGTGIRLWYDPYTDLTFESTQKTPEMSSNDRIPDPGVAEPWYGAYTDLAQRDLAMRSKKNESLATEIAPDWLGLQECLQGRVEEAVRPLRRFSSCSYSGQTEKRQLRKTRSEPI